MIYVQIGILVVLLLVYRGIQQICRNQVQIGSLLKVIATRRTSR